MNKMRDVMEFAQAVMINAQQEQKCQTNCHHQESPQLCVDDKVWLAIGKQYSIKRLSWKLDYKNQKYTVIEVVLLHAVCFNIEGVHFVFYINWLCFAADNPLLSQSQLDNQSVPIHIEGEEKWYVNEIVAEELCCHSCGVMKWFQVKYTGYAVSKWNQAMNMEDTTVLEWWMEHTREFQNAHGRLPDGFWRESRPGRTLWRCAWERGGIVIG